MALPELFTPEQVADHIPGLTVSEIRRAIRSGEMGHVSAARGKWLVSDEHVTEWISSRTKPATTAAKTARPERQPLGSTSRSRNTQRNH